MFIVDIQSEEYNIYNAVKRASTSPNLAIEISTSEAYYIAGVITMNIGYSSMHLSYNRSVSEIMAFFRLNRKSSVTIDEVTQIVSEVMDSRQYDEVVKVLVRLNPTGEDVLPALSVRRVDFQQGTINVELL